MWGLSPVAASGGHSSSRCAGLSPSRPPPVAEQRLQTLRLSSCGSRAQPLRSMRDPPRPGPEPASPASAGRLPTTAPPGKPWTEFQFQLTGCVVSLQLDIENSKPGNNNFPPPRNKGGKVRLSVKLQRKNIWTWHEKRSKVKRWIWWTKYLSHTQWHKS